MAASQDSPFHDVSVIVETLELTIATINELVISVQAAHAPMEGVRSKDADVGMDLGNDSASPHSSASTSSATSYCDCSSLNIGA